ncbi:flavin-binding monooxygenase, partial [Dacryopinax primogenitus]
MSSAWQQPPHDPSHPPDFGHAPYQYKVPPKVPIVERPIDDYRKIKVIVIGAGFSGLCAAIRLPQRIPNVEFVVYEKNPAVGGTWYESHYPGLACDIPSHTYQLTFEPKTDWSAFYSPGPEIRSYLEGVTEKYKLAPHIKLDHKITRAEWNKDDGKWMISGEIADTNEPWSDTADAVISGMGFLNKWKYPNIPGLKDFKGKMCHTGHWTLESAGEAWKDRRVAVVGVGSSAIQVVPALQPWSKQVDNYVRGKTWIAAPIAAPILDSLTGSAKGNHFFTDEEKAKFASDPEAYNDFRLKLEDELNAVHGATIRNSEMQNGARQAFKELMVRKLSKKPEIAEHLIPGFPVACRRLTPGPGYLESLVEDNVGFVTSDIKRITETGIETVDGQHREYDVIVMATGYDTTHVPAFPIIANGENVQDAWREMPITYMSVCSGNVPNWFNSLGPNSAVGSGSLLVLAEKELEYAFKAISKIQREGIKSMTPKASAVDAWNNYMDAYFPRTVYSEKCRSWYKGGKEEGRVTGLWPGSCLHAVFALENPRWEDFDYEFLPDHKGILSWLGNGWTTMEYEEKVGHRAFYLEHIDYPPVPQ